jgi:hypothetical protein
MRWTSPWMWTTPSPGRVIRGIGEPLVTVFGGLFQACPATAAGSSSTARTTECAAPSSGP